MRLLPVCATVLGGTAFAAAHSLDGGMHKMRRGVEATTCRAHVRFTAASSTGTGTATPPSSTATAASTTSLAASTTSAVSTTATSSCAASATATSSASASNPVILQGFEWYTEGGGTLYSTLEEKAAELAEMGITMVWLPPSTKAASGSGSVGYDAYDLWDLGEFDQKGTTATKWGTITSFPLPELVSLISTLKANNVSALLDIVLNHKTGADGTETYGATEMNSTDRTKSVSELHDIEGQTMFTFEGRGGKYSTMQWNHTHFTAVSYDASTDSDGIFLTEGKEWSTAVSTENGNYDYLMFNDICYENDAVKEEILNWGEWVVNETGAEGFRIDAVKHFSYTFLSKFMETVRSRTNKPDLFGVGEFWTGSPSKLEDYLDSFTGGDFQVFDSPLHYNFYDASQAGINFDLRTIFDDTLVASRPNNTVTLVDNHDTQPSQASESWVGSTFKPLAYALILLREEGIPTVFAGDLWGINTTPAVSAMTQLSDFVKARKWFGYGSTTDYFDDASTVGWVRSGDANHDPVAVLMSIGTEEGSKKMQVEGAEEGEVYTDLLGWNTEEVTIEADGYATFKCPAQSVSIWTRTDARGRENTNN
ncbi:hypothetical protein JCM8547_006267 [Rhodosporidiobolus lusitaniae]